MFPLTKPPPLWNKWKTCFWWSLFFHYFQCIIRPTASASLPPSLVLLPLIETGVHLIKAALRGPGLRYVFPPTENSLVSHPVCFLCFYEGYTFVFVLAFVRPKTTNRVSQHLSCCPVTLESSESFGLFVVVVRFQLSGCWVANCKRRS